MDTNTPWIAIVDDDEAIRRALLRLMRAAGLPARAFESGAALLAASADNAPPCCAVLDLHMPFMDGFELLKRLAEISPATSVVLMTGHHTPETSERAARSGAIAYLRKPMDGNQLIAAIVGGCSMTMPETS